MQYQDPGDAFSQGLEHALAQREAQKRQAMLDNLTVQKAAREVDSEANKAEEHRQELAERKAEHDEANRWKVEAQKKQDKDAADKAAAAVKQKADQDAYIAGLPEGSPAKTAYQAEQVGLKTPPSQFSAPKATSMGRALVFDPVKKTYTDTATGQPVVGGLTPQDKIERSAEPKDTSAHDAATSAKEMTRRDNAYKTAVTELDKAADPVAAYIQGIND